MRLSLFALGCLILSSSVAVAEVSDASAMCGTSTEDAVKAARAESDKDIQISCLTAAVERLMQHVENLRTGKEAFEAVQSKVYFHTGEP